MIVVDEGNCPRISSPPYIPCRPKMVTTTRGSRSDSGSGSTPPSMASTAPNVTKQLMSCRFTSATPGFASNMDRTLTFTTMLPEKFAPLYCSATHDGLTASLTATNLPVMVQPNKASALPQRRARMSSVLIVIRSTALRDPTIQRN